MTNFKKHGLLLTVVYSVQYMPLGFLFVALVGIMRHNGLPLERISLVHAAGFFLVFKFIWAPFVDGIGFGKAGHCRAWLLTTHAGILVALLIMSGLDVNLDYGWIVLLGMLIGLLSAPQEAAADALLYRLLPAHERSMGNSVQVAGGLIGNLYGAGAVLMIYPVVGWRGCLFLLMAGVALSIMLLLRFREPAFAVARQDMGAALQRIITFWRRPNITSWLAILALYPLGLSLTSALITPILVDAGWSLWAIGFVVNVVGSFLGLAGAFFAGNLIRRHGRRKTLLATGVLQLPGIALLALPVTGHAEMVGVLSAVAVLFLVYSPVTAALFTVMMDHSSRESPATDFALQYCVFCLVGYAGAGFGVLLAGHFGYLFVIGAASLAVVLSVLISLRYPFQEFSS